jgi:hypothetical protein
VIIHFIRPYVPFKKGNFVTFAQITSMTSNTAAEDSVISDSSQSNSWVRFEEDDGVKRSSQNKETSPQAQPIAAPILNADEYSGAVINPETVHVNVNRNASRSISPEKPDASSNKATVVASSIPQQYSGAVINTESVHLNLDQSSINWSVGEDQQQSESASTTAPGKPQDAGLGMRNIDLSDTNNGRPTPNTRISTFGNSVVRQGFGKLENNNIHSLIHLLIPQIKIH